MTEVEGPHPIPTRSRKQTRLKRVVVRDLYRPAMIPDIFQLSIERHEPQLQVSVLQLLRPVPATNVQLARSILQVRQL